MGEHAGDASTFHLTPHLDRRTSRVPLRDALRCMPRVAVDVRAECGCLCYSTMSRPCAVNAQITVMLIAMSVIDQTG